VRAPSNGTIIERPVSEGMVITSATTSASGGTTILKMADLTKVRMRAFVNETDIGNVQAGQMATVTVDAFPNRRFAGVVEKVEPQAVVQSSVTMFPVLVTLNNSDNALKPGMNGQVVMDIVRKDNVLAVPSDAIRNARDAATVAPVLGVSADSLRAMMAAMRQNRGRGGAASSTASGTARDTTGRRFGGGNFARGAASGTASSTRGGFNRQGSGGAGGAGGAGAFAGGGAGGGGPMIVFVKKDEKYTPHVVRVGISDFDYTEIVSGLQQGDEVALLGAAVLQAQRDELQQRIRSRAGGGLQQQQPQTPAGGAAGGGGGGGGGNRGGGNRGGG
jgi:HlyD family secretion protein